jgi:hypothetical protein
MFLHRTGLPSKSIHRTSMRALLEPSPYVDRRRAHPRSPRHVTARSEADRWHYSDHAATVPTPRRPYPLGTWRRYFPHLQSHLATRAQPRCHRSLCTDSGRRPSSHCVTHVLKICHRVEAVLKPLLGVVQATRRHLHHRKWQRRSIQPLQGRHNRQATPVHLWDSLRISKHPADVLLLPNPSTFILHLSCGMPPVSSFGRHAPPSRSCPSELPSSPLPKTSASPHRLPPRPAPPHLSDTGCRI